MALILTFASISGAHFNPLVTLLAAIFGRFCWAKVPWYFAAQIIGGLLGVILAHVMCGLPLVTFSQHPRSGGGQWSGEFIATLGLLLIIAKCAEKRPESVPYAVGAYITSAYWFTSSTSFANPAVTIARCVTDTFAGIRPRDVAGFILAQTAGAIAAVLLLFWFQEKRLRGNAEETV